MKKLNTFFILLTIPFILLSKEYHVAKTGNDTNAGNFDAPFLTIQKAASIAHPGDEIIVHKGIYREWIKPPRGGTSDSERIVYRAAEGEKVEIRGSEIVKNWEKFKGSVWKVQIPNVFFNDYNPYKDKIHGDWFNDHGRVHHTGDVYLDGVSLWESAILENVINKPKQEIKIGGDLPHTFWYCESDEKNTFIYADFGDADPNKETVEINVRKSCFYPEKNNVNFISISGFVLKHAATQWAPPTAEQIGLIGTNWSKGWIIENNIISDSRCSGITLGKHGDEFDNTSENSAVGYVETIKRAIARGWSKENIGSHIIRNNKIFNCEQTGICGSMGGIFSVIENNEIYNIWKKRQFSGAEMGGIKIHAAINMLIKNNRLQNCGRGLWLDWMAQGTRVTGNILINNTTDDIFVEVNHGPFIIDNNILLSRLSVRDWSEGGAYVHNLFAGNFELRPQGRYTPVMAPNSARMMEVKQTFGGDNRFYNNIFMDGFHEKNFKINGLNVYEKTEFPMFVNGNVYFNGVEAFKNEQNNMTGEANLNINVDKEKNILVLEFEPEIDFSTMKTDLITSQFLGKALIPNQKYTKTSGEEIIIDTDYFGKKRDKNNPVAGPFENIYDVEIEIKIN